MARGINKVILVGNLGQAPELKYTPTGAAVCNISIATSEHWKDKTTGQKQEKTEWHKVTFFNRLAEVVGEHLQKGSMIYIEGKLQTRKWQAQDGSDRYSTEIIANEMQMLSGKQSSANSSSAQYPQQNLSPDFNQSTQQQAAQDFDDDIPF